MGTVKKAIGFRLSETTIKELTSIAANKKVSQADVIAVLVHCYYLNDDIDSETIDQWFDIARIS